MKRIFTGIVCLLAISSLQAQTAVDALRYSMLIPGGTARSMGMSGSFGALGADFSVASTNPGGLGLYRSTEVFVSPQFVTTTTESNYFGNVTDEDRLNFNIGNFGLMATKLRDESKLVRAISFGLGYNRLANFHQKSFYQGYNPDNTILDVYLPDVNGVPAGSVNPGTVGFNPFLAYNTYLINLDPSFPDSATYLPVIRNGNIQQQGIVTEEGALDEYAFSLAFNINDRIYLGTTIGLPNISYERDIQYSETDVNDSVPHFEQFTLDDYQVTDGIGVNAKFGLVVRAHDYLRLGVAVHSPSRLFLQDDYSSQMVSRFDTIVYVDASPEGQFKYRLSTPWRVVTSVGIILKKFGAINIEHEFVDYSASNFDFDSPFQSAASERNQTIEQIYGQAHNLRIGAEFRWEYLRFRAGYGLYGNPMEGAGHLFTDDRYARSISFGLGYRGERYFIDAAYVNTAMQMDYSPYELDANMGTTPVVSQDMTRQQFVLTAGFRFNRQ